jgi:hypothetical protein
MINRLVAVSTLILIVLTLPACSGKTIIPIIDEIDNTISLESLPSGVSEWDRAGNPSEGDGLLGLFNLHIDPDDLKAELISTRNSALTDVLEVVDITNFLRMAPCTDCVKLRSVSINPDGNLVLSIGIKHPFLAGDPLKPVTGRNRADLHVFNVEGMIVSSTGSHSFSGVGKSIADLMLLNADGYTGYLDDSLDDIYPTDASLHPYILHFDDYSQGNFSASNPMGFETVTTPSPSGNLVMPMGCDYDYQDYVFDLDSPVDLIYAVGCTYAVSAASKIERFTPEYRIPQHSKKAASEVKIEIVSNDLRSGIVSSSADIEVHIIDISHGVSVGSALDQMLAESNVDDIFIDIPGILTSPVVLDGSAPVSGTGHDPSDPLIYAATIVNNAGGEEGIYRGLVKVSDTYPPGLNTSPLLNGMDGIRRVNPTENPLTGLFQITEFATYQAFTISVAPGCGPITGSIDNPASCPVTGVSSGQSIAFSASASSANGGDPVILYEWDMDYDGITFDIDDTGASVILGPFINPNCGTPPEDPVTFTVAVRAQDSCNPPNIVVFATCDVTVDTCPSADVPQNMTITVNRLSASNKHRIDESGPFTIDWDAPIASTPASYAIYVDRDPSNGYDDYSYLAEVMNPTTQWTGDGAAYTSAERFVPGWTYVVRARAVAGDPASESADSEQVHVITSGFETAPGGDVGPPGYYTTLDDTESWFSNQENSFGGVTLYTTYAYNSNCVSNSITSEGCGYVRLDLMIGNTGTNYPGRWMGMLIETPTPSTMANISVRYLDFVTVSRGYCDSAADSGGILIGTCPSLPSENWSNPEIFDWAEADDSGSHDAYQANNQSFLYQTFDTSPYNDVPTTGPNCWYYFTADTSWDYNNKRLRGGNVNEFGDSSDPYIGIESSHSAYASAHNPETCLDEVSIAIY